MINNEQGVCQTYKWFIFSELKYSKILKVFGNGQFLFGFGTVDQ